MALKTPLAYFFFSSESGNLADPFFVVRSWLCQMIIRSSNAFEVASEVFQMKEANTALRADIMELLRPIVQKIPNCTFVLDGLDECAWTKDGYNTTDDDSSHGFLIALKNAIAQTNSRVLISSRNQVNIRSEIYVIPSHDSDQMVYEVSISSHDVQSDLKLFSQHVVNTKSKNKDEAIRNRLSQKVVEKCDGMFLWFKMLEDSPRGGKSTKQLEEIIDNAPTQLNSLYDRNWKANLQSF